ncbi:MAG: four helix bundle protein [Fidelibacterota bacterium]
MDITIQKRSFDFSLKIVNLYKHLRYDQKEYVLSKQILRSGTSIGANIEEAYAAQSKKDFISKMNIALKEARETYYWLRLLKESGYIAENEILSDCETIKRILG